ncbi:helix-turn-helix domain-containing protein [Kineococcus auxinigenes]|uniref:helix-turn-helix domain-containing protein n=1 Tax=unclassified Kineococcus TaxID=2621656 RepID=UPI003D7D33E9
MPASIDIPSPEDPEAALAAVVALRRLAGQLEAAAVAEAAAQGRTWSEIGQAPGVSAQAVHKEFAAQVRR